VPYPGMTFRGPGPSDFTHLGSVVEMSHISGRDDENPFIERGDIVPGSSKDRKCPWCPKMFIDGSELKSHLGSIHATHSEVSDSTRKEGSGRLSCPKSGCSQMLASYDALCRHCVEEHDFGTEYHNERFDDEKDFEEWLGEWSSVAGEMVRRRGKRKTADGIIMGDYHCVFDGKKRETPSTRAPDRNPYNRRVPSKKLGFACPAYIRYQMQVDGSVSIRAQMTHFGHDTQPADVSRRFVLQGDRIIGRRKDRRRGYTFYEENIPQRSGNQMTEDDGIEVDDQGMVNLFAHSSLQRARFIAQTSLTSVDIAFTEVQSIPHDNAHHLSLLIEKFHEISAAANWIEGMLKDLSHSSSIPIHPPHHTFENDSSAKRQMYRQLINRKIRLPVEMKEEADDIEKEGRLKEKGSHDEESFEQQSDSGEMEFHGDIVSEEVVVDDEDE
ncbi:hypothetical protein PENTCL1PPCAC_2248, partial [Pristionchus entomophagus]